MLLRALGQGEEMYVGELQHFKREPKSAVLIYEGSTDEAPPYHLP